jgi:regulator of cell morphogenesis and NO signaling
MDRPEGVDQPLDVMCDDIVERYHAALHRLLPRLRDELASLAVSRQSHALDSMLLAFTDLADQISAHLSKEENLLFPAFAALAVAEESGKPPSALPFVTVLHPIRVMEADHSRIEEELERLHEIVLTVAEVDTRSESWRRCMSDLAALDANLREHHRTENEILFPRALELERRLL